MKLSELRTKIDEIIKNNPESADHLVLISDNDICYIEEIRGIIEVYDDRHKGNHNLIESINIVKDWYNEDKFNAIEILL